MLMPPETCRQTRRTDDICEHCGTEYFQKGPDRILAGVYNHETLEIPTPFGFATRRAGRQLPKYAARHRRILTIQNI